MPDSSYDAVILLDILADDYSFFTLSLEWRARLEFTRCPACGTRGLFRRHGSYHKYHYLKRIQLLRVRSLEWVRRQLP